VGERGEVAGAAERAVLADHRRDAGGDHRGIGPGGLEPYAGPAGRQRGEPQQHERPDDLALDLGAAAGRVGADEAALQLRAQLGGDVAGREGAEPGGDAVVRLDVVGQRLDQLAAVRDRCLGLLGEPDSGAVARNGQDVLGRDGADPDGDHLHDHYSTPGGALSTGSSWCFCLGSETYA